MQGECIPGDALSQSKKLKWERNVNEQTVHVCRSVFCMIRRWVIGDTFRNNRSIESICDGRDAKLYDLLRFRGEKIN